MSNNLESVVRPFQLPSYVPPDRIPTAQVVVAKPVILNYGRAGSVKTMSGNYSSTVTFYMKKIMTEQQQQ